MKRGDIHAVVLPGDLGKPRPAVIIQAIVPDDAASVNVLALTGTMKGSPLVRVTLDPSAENGLKKVSQVMVDKCATIARAKVGPRIGRLSEGDMAKVSQNLGVWLGILA